ncbi:MAG: hypothetical protein M3Y87_19335 [Myxococcota bacterium]|nr:hypothetical protein [Myxococcota bacterium]
MTGTSREPDGDADLAQLRVRGTVSAAAALNGMSGVIAVLSGVQFTTSAAFHDPLYNVVPWALVGLGVVQLGLALLVMRNSHGATIALSFLAPLITMVALGWAMLAWTNGFHSFIAVCEIPLAGSAAVLAPFALGPTRRARDAKRRLQDAGMDLGF